jgi:Protein of unknown function (DUF2937)
MIRRFLAMFAGGLGAVAASQAPEFAQQYTQRLGGALDELKGIVRSFDQDAGKAGLTREDGLQRLERTADAFVAGRGRNMRIVIERFETLQQQKEAMAAPDVVTRVGAMVKQLDPAIARKTMDDFKPALPLTVEGAFFALLGFLAGALITGIVALPMGRRLGRPRESRTGVLKA